LHFREVAAENLAAAIEDQTRAVWFAAQAGPATLARSPPAPGIAPDGSTARFSSHGAAS
jgi:hypothetical protein